MPEIEAPKPTSFTCALVSGASAGLFVDIALFPIDTLKTRLQSPHGFFKAGGFRGIYSGLSATALGSAPGASLFFSTYETMKAPAKKVTSSDVLSQQLAASVGECVACLVRVPTEVVKQNMQAGNYSTMGEATRSLFATEGIGGFYRGFLSTVMREIPFSLIQFPLWEGSKKKWGEAQGRPVSPWQGTICGALSGGFSGAITTPLDLAKTRLMLGADAQGVPYKGVFDVWTKVYQEGGIQKLYTGAGPRTFWLTLGGMFFFGAYEQTRAVLQRAGV